MTLHNIPEVWLSYKWIYVIHVYHGDMRALLRGFNCDIRGPGALFIPNTVDDTQQAQAWSRPLIGANDIVGRGGEETVRGIVWRNRKKKYSY